MGNCNFKDKSKNQDNQVGRITLNNLEKLNKNHFNYLYAIGKGGFGRVNFI